MSTTDCVRETPEVLVFVRLGLSERRARAFVRWLDDANPVGISGAFLAKLVQDALDVERGRQQEEVDRLVAQRDIMLAKGGQLSSLFT